MGPTLLALPTPERAPMEGRAFCCPCVAWAWAHAGEVSEAGGDEISPNFTAHRSKNYAFRAGKCLGNDEFEWFGSTFNSRIQFRTETLLSRTNKAAGGASPAAIGGPDTRTVLLGHQPQFVKQSDDAAGVGRVCIVGRLWKGWRLFHRLVVPGLDCYLVTLDADGGGGMPMREPKKGRRSPGKEREPREFGRQDAAPQKTPDEKSPECSHHTEVPSDLPSNGDWCTAGSPVVSVADDREVAVGDVVFDTGWHDCNGARVRLVLTAAEPSPSRDAWFRRILLGTRLSNADGGDLSPTSGLDMTVAC